VTDAEAIDELKKSSCFGGIEAKIFSGSSFDTAIYSSD
jgi:hypothetical protein